MYVARALVAHAIRCRDELSQRAAREPEIPQLPKSVVCG
jgi:hypothetical protein